MNIIKQKNTSILMIDSGIGGLSTMITSSKQTTANYIYFADNKHSPYGEKSTDFLQNRLSEIILSLSKKYEFNIVVLACNTATTSSINFLRNKFPQIKFIGTEPAYKIAIDNNYEKPAIIATTKTISNLSNHLPIRFNLISSKTLAINIENYFLNSSISEKFKLIKNLYQIKSKLSSNDCLILGCTHYNFIREKLSKIVNIPIFDGNLGVAKQISKSITQKNSKKSNYKIILSNQKSIYLQKYKKILKQILANQINL